MFLVYKRQALFTLFDVSYRYCTILITNLADGPLPTGFVTFEKDVESY